MFLTWYAHDDSDLRAVVLRAEAAGIPTSFSAAGMVPNWNPETPAERRLSQAQSAVFESRGVASWNWALEFGINRVGADEHWLPVWKVVLAGIPSADLAELDAAILAIPAGPKRDARVDFSEGMMSLGGDGFSLEDLFRLRLATCDDPVRFAALTDLRDHTLSWLDDRDRISVFWHTRAILWDGLHLRSPDPAVRADRLASAIRALDALAQHLVVPAITWRFERFAIEQRTGLDPFRFPGGFHETRAQRWMERNWDEGRYGDWAADRLGNLLWHLVVRQGRAAHLEGWIKLHQVTKDAADAVDLYRRVQRYAAEIDGHGELVPAVRRLMLDASVGMISSLVRRIALARVQLQVELQRLVGGPDPDDPDALVSTPIHWLNRDGQRIGFYLIGRNGRDDHGVRDWEHHGDDVAFPIIGSDLGPQTAPTSLPVFIEPNRLPYFWREFPSEQIPLSSISAWVMGVTPLIGDVMLRHLPIQAFRPVLYDLGLGNSAPE